MNVAVMSLSERLRVVVQKAVPMLPGDAGHRLLALLSPESLAVMAGVVVLWAGSHFVGVGEVADVVMLAAGWLAGGAAAVDAAKKLIAFAIATTRARTEADLDVAARDLAGAVSIIGIDVAFAMLFKARPRSTFRSIYKPQFKIPPWSEFRARMRPAGPTRMYRPTIVFTKKRLAGFGGTNPLGEATIGRDFYPGPGITAKGAAREVRKAVFHEQVHQRIIQGFSLLGRPGLYARMGAYKRSFILRYIEEAAAETRGLSKVGGPQGAEVAGYKFPFDPNYEITLVQMGTEAKGILLGPVMIGGITYQAWFGWRH